MRQPTLLIVDDEPANVGLIRKAVESGLASRRVTARNGDEAPTLTRELPAGLAPLAAHRR